MRPDQHSGLSWAWLGGALIGVGLASATGCADTDPDAPGAPGVGGDQQAGADSGSEAEAGTSGIGGDSSAGAGEGGAGGAAGQAGSGGAGLGGSAVGGAGAAGGSGGMSGEAGAAGTPTMGGMGGAGGAGGADGEGASCPKPDGQICHEFVAADNGRHELLYVNEFEPTQSWSQAIVDKNGGNSPRQLQIVDNARATNGQAVLISVDSGYEEYDLVSHTLLDSVNLGAVGVRGAQRLPDGNTALGIGDAVLRIVDGAGASVGAECNLPGAGSDTLRILTYDAATQQIYYGRGMNLYAVNLSCEEQWSATFPEGGSKAYRVIPRDGGGAWATSGEPSTVIKVDAAGQVVATFGTRTAHPDLLDFFSGFDLTQAGNVVVANWWGHIMPPPQEGPHLVEFNAANELVWRWGTQTEAAQITNVLVLR